MGVYVDTLMNHGWRLRGRIIKSCHLWADTEAEVHAMAAIIGMKREWYQHGSIDHYDLNDTMRARAVMQGTMECDRDTAVAKWREMRAKKKMDLTTNP